MRIKIEYHGTVFEFERQRMEIGRFTILCKLAGAVIGGVVLAALVRMLGVWGIVWPVGALALIGLYKLMQEI